jgi:hypothetical protein
VSVNSEDDNIEIHIQTVVDGKVYRFTHVKHKRIRVGGEECECFYSSRDALRIEQRKAYRCGVSVPCQVARSVDTTAQSATIKDVSITGAALLSMGLDMNVGDYVKVRFTDKMKPLKEDEETEVVNINFAATVVRTRPLGRFTEYGLSIKECNGNVLSKYINTKQRLQMKKNREELEKSKEE